MTERESAHPASHSGESLSAPANESPLLDENSSIREGDGMEGPDSDIVRNLLWVS